MGVEVRGTPRKLYMLHDGRRWWREVLILTRTDDGTQERHGVAEGALLEGQNQRRTSPKGRRREGLIVDLRR